MSSKAWRRLLTTAPIGCIAVVWLLPLVDPPPRSSGAAVPAIDAARMVLTTHGAVRADGAPRERIAPGWEALLTPIDDAVAEALHERKMPGCVVVVGRGDEVLFQRAYGQRAILPTPRPMTLDTVFDLASLTKPMATATSVLLLADRGMIGLDDPVARHVPAFARKGKAKITVRHLLTHMGGLPADTPMRDFEAGPDEAVRRLWDLVPRAKPGERFTYSDVGYLVLQELVQRVSGEDLATFSQRNVFVPLGMDETTFVPGPAMRERAAPTEVRGDHWMQGEVHDPRAFLMGGVAGHAGLFSTATDVTRYAQAMLRGGALGGARILSKRATAAFLAPHDVPGGVRAPGWDARSAFSANRGEGLSLRAVGHGGYTGTALWLDPELDLFVLFLSNRVHPEGKGLVNPLVRSIGTIAVAAVAAHDGAGRAPLMPGEVRTGIDALRAEDFQRLRGARVGLLTNKSGVARDGATTIELLARAPNVQLVALFSPEHGLTGAHEGKIADTRDSATGLPVYSLYGASLRPRAETLAGIDTLVVDLQDVGTRFYTYASTMRRAMEAAAAEGLRFVVLDRPNPIGGTAVSGPLLDVGAANGFVNHHPLPVRHGMTMGELAHLFNADLHLGAALEVVRVEGWKRADDWDATGLPWINPSPNLRSVTETVLYPAVGLLESTNVSVGRGTGTPFEIVGAPWIDGPTLAEALTRAALPGVEFEASEFSPDAEPYAGKTCQGVRLKLTSRAAFEPVRTAVAMARELRALYAGDWHFDDMAKILGNTKVMDALRAGKPVDEIEATWTDELRAFQRKRDKYLLYP